MNTIEIKGIEYVKASVIAENFGYTTDYVGQLCRGEKVDATLVGRTWYVNPDSIHDHKSTRYRSYKVKVQQDFKKSIHLHIEKTTAARPRGQVHLAVHLYTPDDSELFPVVAKSAPSAPITLVHPVRASVHHSIIDVHSTADISHLRAEKEVYRLPNLKGNLQVAALDETEPEPVSPAQEVTPSYAVKRKIPVAAVDAGPRDNGNAKVVIMAPPVLQVSVVSIVGSFSLTIVCCISLLIILVSLERTVTTDGIAAVYGWNFDMSEVSKLIKYGSK